MDGLMSLLSLFKLLASIPLPLKDHVMQPSTSSILYASFTKLATAAASLFGEDVTGL